MNNAKFFRTKITHRTAVRELIKIAEELLPHGRCSLDGYYNYDQSVNNMINEIRRMKKEVKEYNRLKDSLRVALCTPFNNI